MFGLRVRSASYEREPLRPRVPVKRHKVDGLFTVPSSDSGLRGLSTDGNETRGVGLIAVCALGLLVAENCAVQLTTKPADRRRFAMPKR